jgi:hypothetical protein
MKIQHIIVHCSDSEFGTAALIREWHLARGFKDIGYHKVVLNGVIAKGHWDGAYDGMIEDGRPIGEDDELTGPEIGAHCLGYNQTSIGICFIGVDQFSLQQRITARGLLYDLMNKYDIPLENVLGHCETVSGMKEGKTCPNMDMAEFRRRIK